MSGTEPGPFCRPSRGSMTELWLLSLKARPIKASHKCRKCLEWPEEVSEPHLFYPTGEFPRLTGSQSAWLCPDLGDAAPSRCSAVTSGQGRRRGSPLRHFIRVLSLGGTSFCSRFRHLLVTGHCLTGPFDRKWQPAYAQ